MNLGIVVTNENHGEVALGLLEEAATRGWQLRCFLSDTGVKLLNDSRFVDFCQGEHWVALCELSLERYHIETSKVQDVAPNIIIGGQYQDAELVKNSDQVLVF
ncbi:MAG: hypothetical protein OQK76_03810 [Gammaproteobacteria bacterium]|nr:hypothetical protein [Gammaproteobacteria bacterium]MCW8909731.1 hypothetical protein [Gammaproteobacteria bacterium]MCW9004936.1 hypothetical protein [Gammaproteobacteria bacterium]MCW9056332.1 hypothetical protein [Gammaproteobacteria bacterium]